MVSGSETPHSEDLRHFCQWRSPRSSLGCGGTRASHLRSASVCWRQWKEAQNLLRVVAHLKWEGDRYTLLMLYRDIVRSKFDYGCIVYGTASNTNLQQLDSIHNSGLRLALGAFCTSPVSSLYTEANEAPLEERWLKLSMHYYVKTRACIENPAHHALHEFDRTTRDLYAPRPNGRGGMTRPPAPPIGLKIEEAMTSAEINAELVCPLRTPNFPPAKHDYDPKRHDLIGGVSKCMISRQEAQAKFNEHKDHMMKSTLMAPKWTREWGQRRSSTAISRMVRQPAANCPKDCQTTAPSLQLRLQPSVWHLTITNTWAQSIMMW